MITVLYGKWRSRKGHSVRDISNGTFYCLLITFNHEKTFRDRGSGFDCYPIDYGTTGTWRDKNKFSCVFNNLKHNIHVNIN